MVEHSPRILTSKEKGHQMLVENELLMRVSIREGVHSMGLEPAVIFLINFCHSAVSGKTLHAKYF